MLLFLHSSAVPSCLAIDCQAKHLFAISLPGGGPGAILRPDRQLFFGRGGFPTARIWRGDRDEGTKAGLWGPRCVREINVPCALVWYCSLLSQARAHAETGEGDLLASNKFCGAPKGACFFLFHRHVCFGRFFYGVGHIT